MKVAVFSAPDPSCGDHLPVIIGTNHHIYRYAHAGCGSGRFSADIGGAQDITTDFIVGDDGMVYQWDPVGTTWRFYIDAPWGVDTKIGGWVNGIFAVFPSTTLAEMDMIVER